MQDTPSSLSPLTKRILLFSGIVLALVVVVFGTAFLLKNVLPKKESASLAVINAEEVVAMYRVPGAISGLSESLYDQQLDDGMNVPVVYKSADHEYMISTQTPSSVLFYSKTPSSQDDVKSIQDQTAVFMRSKGYEPVKSSVVSGDDSPERAQYASKSAICQLTSSGKTTPEGVPASHQFACVENAAIDAEYAAIETLLGLYSGAKKDKPSFTAATRSFANEGDKAYAILQLTTKQNSPSLLFASVDDQWSYLGNLSDPASESNGKYVITPEIKAKISDSKYGNFLTRNLLGETSS